MFDLTKEELKAFKKLNTAKKIQDFLNKTPINFEPNGDTCMSPCEVLKQNKCHCIEGAIFAYFCFKVNNQEAFLVDLKTTKNDFEHVICVFKKFGKWGAISKTNHAVLRYREPVYSSIRELVMSYFHEYTDDYGNKTLRSFSIPISLEKFNDKWYSNEENLWKIYSYLDHVKHFKILNRRQIWNLRKADNLEIKAGEITEYKKQ